VRGAAVRTASRSGGEQRLRAAVQLGLQIFDYDIKITKKAKPLRLRVGEAAA